MTSQQILAKFKMDQLWLAGYWADDMSVTRRHNVLVQMRLARYAERRFRKIMRCRRIQKRFRDLVAR